MDGDVSHLVTIARRATCVKVHGASERADLKTKYSSPALLLLLAVDGDGADGDDYASFVPQPSLVFLCDERAFFLGGRSRSGASTARDLL